MGKLEVEMKAGRVFSDLDLHHEWRKKFYWFSRISVYRQSPINSQSTFFFVSFLPNINIELIFCFEWESQETKAKKKKKTLQTNV